MIGELTCGDRVGRTPIHTPLLGRLEGQVESEELVLGSSSTCRWFGQGVGKVSAPGPDGLSPHRGGLTVIGSTWYDRTAEVGLVIGAGFVGTSPRSPLVLLPLGLPPTTTEESEGPRIATEGEVCGQAPQTRREASGTIRRTRSSITRVGLVPEIVPDIDP